MDYGSRYTDKRERMLALRLRKVYREAQKDLEKSLDTFLKKHAETGKEMWDKLQNGEITKEAYSEWMRGQVLKGKEWQKKIDDATDMLKLTNEKALTIIRGEQMNVFSENANFESKKITKDFSGGIRFDIYDTATVDRLIRDKPELLPRKTVNGRKDKAWNRGIISNAVTQAIIQGESISKLAARLSRDTAGRDMRAMVRYARTAMTGAQNAGRIETMHRAQDMGINVKKQWLATMDSRTRDSHRHLDGDIVDVDKKFSNGLLYPGDPEGPPGEVYNCRCTLLYIYPDFDEESVQAKPEYTEQEISALEEYGRSGYSGINTLLREHRLDEYPDAKKLVEKIDKAMEKSTLEKDTVVSRGTGFNELAGLFDKRSSWFEEAEHLDSLVGKTATADSYLSTTKGPEAIEEYSKRGVEWTFNVEAGSHAVDIENTLNLNASKVEGELLLDRGAEIKVTKVEYEKDEDGYVTGKIRIFADVSYENKWVTQKVEQTRKSGTHYKEGENKRKIIPQPVYNKITKKAEKEGAVIRRGGNEVLEYLKKRGATASTIGNDIFLRDDPTTTEVLEEIYHFRQNKKGVNDDKGIAERFLRNEIEAQKYLISVADRFNIPQEERNETAALLESYERQLKELEAKK